MKGFVPTPPDVVDQMVAKLFRAKHPTPDTTLLDPGCGTGSFIEGVIRWCDKKDLIPPHVLGVEPHPVRFSEAKEKFAQFDFVEIEQRDFLIDSLPPFDHVIGNPPYVPITELTEKEKAQYRKYFATAHGRFDLYILFFERAVKLLKPEGRLVFITPDKYLTVHTAKPLRRIFSRHCVKEIELLPEDTFADLVTYPAITTLDKTTPNGSVNLSLRDGTSRTMRFSDNGASLAPQMYDQPQDTRSSTTLAQCCQRISAGVATGADKIFVAKTSSLDAELQSFAYPTIAGRQLSHSHCDLHTIDSFLVPYDAQGDLLPPDSLGALGGYLSEPKRKQKLLSRSCVPRKPWYAFHETPPMDAILRPKILCKDITPEPNFWMDRGGSLIPRHSVYYIVPNDVRDLELLTGYLNSDWVTEWLEANCQRAANDYLRLQSTPLKRIPLPEELVKKLRGGPDHSNGSKELSSMQAPTLFQ